MAQSTKTFSSKQEKMVARELGGYQIGGSGAMPCAPGDVKTYEWLVECKTHTTPGQNITFNADVWTKIKNEAVGFVRKPVLIVDDGSQSASRTWCLCRTTNLNLATVVTCDLPVKVRKNIICSHDKLADALKEAGKPYIGAFYEGVAFELDWEGDTVVILPLKLFKELFEK